MSIAPGEQTRDAIDDLVDWQLANPPPKRYMCRACKSAWTGTPLVCPECLTAQ